MNLVGIYLGNFKS